MEFGSLLVAVSASGAGGSVFLISFIVYHGLWHDFRSLDKAPRWFVVKQLVACGILRVKEITEVVYERSFGENCVVFTALSYIVLGFVIFGSGIYSIALLNSIRDGTCQYAEETGTRCSQSNCSTACGRPTFTTCGIVVCDKMRCSADVSAFMRIAGDSSSIFAADLFETLQRSLTVVQARTLSALRDITPLYNAGRYPISEEERAGVRCTAVANGLLVRRRLVVHPCPPAAGHASSD